MVRPRMRDGSFFFRIIMISQNPWRCVLPRFTVACALENIPHKDHLRMDEVGRKIFVCLTEIAEVFTPARHNSHGG